MSAAHTPGPWSLDLCDDGAFAVYVPPSVDMGWSTVITSRNQLPDRADESHANARLIAAAPELLDALQTMLVGSRYYGNGVWETVRMPSEEALCKAADSIAKATGAAA